MALNVGSVFVSLGAKTESKGFEDFDRKVVKAQRVKDINVNLGADVDERGFAAYERKLAEARATAARAERFKVKFGADYDPKVFRAVESDLRRVEQQARSTGRETHALSGLFGALRTGATVLPRQLTGVAEGLVGVAESASKLGGSIGGAGGGVIGGLGALAGGMGALVGIAGVVGAVLVSLVGALTALASSAVAAVAGIAAIGVAATAAAGPLAALAGAVAVRFAAIVEAYKAVGKEADKSGAAATSHAQAQRSAAQQVKSAEQGLADAQRTTQKAQENLTQARFKARREVQDLADAVKHAALDEEGASLSLDEALKRLAEVQADPKSSQLDIHEAQFAVKQANQGIKDAHQERSRADTDRKKGTDTVKQAQDQLASAMRAQAKAADGVAAAQAAAQTATEKQGGAADDAQAKLANLDATERHLLGTFKGFADSLSGMFRPATDAIFSGVDKALGRLGPLILSFKGRFTDLGKSIGGIIDDASKNLAGPEWGKALDSFIATSRRVVKPISDSVGSVLVILRNIAVAAQPYVVDLANGIRDALGGLAGKTNDAKGLSGVIKGLVGQARSWAGLMGSVAKFFYLVFNGSKDDGKTLVDTLKKIVDHWNHFLGTKDGQRRMHDFFKDSVEFAKKLFGWIGDVGGALIGLSLWVQHNGPGFIDFFKRHKGLMEAIAGFAVTFKTAMVTASTIKLGKDALAVLGFGGGGGAAAKGAAGEVATVGRAGGGAAAGAGSVVAGGAALPIIVSAAVAAAILELQKRTRPTTSGGIPTSGNLLQQLGRQVSGQFNLGQPQRISGLGEGDLRQFGDQVDKVKGKLDQLSPKQLVDLAKRAREFAGEFPKYAKGLDQFADAADKAGQDVRKRWGSTLDAVEKDTDSTFGLMRKNTAGHLSDIKTAVETNTAVIKQRLRDDPEAGRKALAHTFRQAAGQIQDSMDAGTISTSTGTREIRRLMIAALKQLGFTESQADLKLGSGLRHGQVQQSQSQRQPGQGLDPTRGGQRGGYLRDILAGRRSVRRAVGGWIGRRGMVSDDVVPIGDGALAAFGEYDAHGPGGSRAILNRHQAPFAEMMLAAGGYPGLDALPGGQQLPILEQALGPIGGLDRLFSTVTRPHYYQSGGFGNRSAVDEFNHTYPAHHTGTPGIALTPDVVMAIAQSQGLPGRAFEQIAHGESNYQPGIVEWPPEADGAQGYGLWQLTTGHVDAPVVALIKRLGGWGEMLNPVKNAKAAKALFDIGGLGRWHGTRFLGQAGSAGASASRASAAAAPVVAPKIIGPITKIGGGVGAMVQRGLDVTTSAANSQLKRLAAMAPSAPGGTPGPTGGPAGTTSFKGITMAKWVADALRHAQSKGVQSQPTSGYRPGFDPHTASGASEHQGLQYPHGAVDFGSFTTGLAAKMAVVNATQDFKWPLLAPIGFRDDGHASGTGHRRGGFLQRFASGGRKFKYTGAPGQISTATGDKENRGIIRSVARGETGIIGFEDTIQTKEREYDQLDRKFGISTETLLIQHDDGSVTVDQGALRARLAEIDALIKKREEIMAVWRSYQKALLNLANTLRAQIKKLTGLIKKAKGSKARKKDRGIYQSELNTYQTRLGEVQGVRASTKLDVRDQSIDLQELQVERADVASTTGEPATPVAQTALDAGQTVTAAALDKNVALAALTPDTADDEAARAAEQTFWTGVLANLQATGAPDALITEAANTLKGFLPAAGATPADNAAAILAQLATFQSGRADLLTQFGRDFVTPFEAARPGGPLSGAPDELTAAAGVRYFGGTSSGSLGMGAGGPTVVIQDGAAFARFASAPADAPTFMQQVRFQVENGVG